MQLVINILGHHMGPISNGILLKMGPIGCPKISADNSQSTLRNFPEEQTSQLGF